jgi:iron complex outermembrane receptor protein
MGAKDLMDVLHRTVPGVSFSTDISGIRGFQVRGAPAFNTVLLMINSHPVNRTYGGDWPLTYDDLIIENIKRIEVIRGPGSAVYGANAFHGVINVITKEADDIDGLELIARGGSWDTQQYNLLCGKSFSDLEVAFDFNFFKTHGFRGYIEEDFQSTVMDPLFGSSASLAPGRTQGDREKYDAALTLKYRGFKFDGKYVDREWDAPVTIWATLSNNRIYSIKDYYLTLSYETRIWEGLDFYGKVYRNKNEFTFNGQIFPPGFVGLSPTGPAIWPDGLINKGGDEGSRTGIEIQTTYKMSESNTVVVGATYEHQKAEDLSLRANWLPTPDPNVIIPLPSVQKWPEAIADEHLMDEETRNLKAVFFEDVWDITDDLRLTLGARYDHYDDFGDHFSPRAGLTWEYMKGYDLKLLYGHAFRAPSFQEFYHPTSGNPDLDPEKIDTYEISLGAEFTSSFNGRVTYYYRKAKDDIIFVFPGINENLGTFRDQGLELEMRYDFGRGTYLAGNYNYQDWKDEPSPFPKHTGKVMANIRLSRHLNFYADCYLEDGWERWMPDDTRDDPSGYEIVNVTLIAKKFLKGYKGLELRGSVYNLFDEDYTFSTGPELPNDLPMPDRHYLFEVKYKF